MSGASRSPATGPKAFPATPLHGGAKTLIAGRSDAALGRSEPDHERGAYIEISIGLAPLRGRKSEPMKEWRWFWLREVEKIPTHAVLAFDEGSGFTAAYSRLLDQWYILVPGQGEEKIRPPQKLFLPVDRPEPDWLDDPAQMQFNF